MTQKNPPILRKFGNFPHIPFNKALYYAVKHKIVHIETLL